MWLLQLNDMRLPKTEHIAPVATAETKEALVAFLEKERVGAYQDGPWAKTFRKGGPLEWFNSPEINPPGIPPIRDLGTAEDWAERGRQAYAQTLEIYRNGGVLHLEGT